jgi:glucose/arabinose dehydrogenase
MRVSRSRVVAAVGLVAALAAGGLYVAGRDEPKTLGDYCGPPDVVEEVPSLSAEERTVTPGYEHLTTVESALAVSEAPGDRLFVAAKDGRLWQAPMTGGPPTMVLDLSAEVATKTEQGLLGVAVHPDGDVLYVDATFQDGTARLLEYALTPDGIDVSTRRDVLVVDDPHPSHNGGHLAFDSEGMLLFGIGDGGNGDQTGAAQDLGSLFGKLLRIDPRASSDGPYSIPDDNPAIEGARPEVLAYGFRNPWGWSLDPATDDLWVGDVGQVCFEEIDVAPDKGAGANFGWPFVEGAHVFEGPVLGLDGEPAGVDRVDLGKRPDGLVAPVLEYGHSDSACSVIGGVVYRGSAVPELDGTYLWADLCERAVHTLRRDGDRWVAGVLGGEVPAGIVAFGQSASGEVYLVSLNDGVYRITSP